MGITLQACSASTPCRRPFPSLLSLTKLAVASLCFAGRVVSQSKRDDEDDGTEQGTYPTKSRPETPLGAT